MPRPQGTFTLTAEPSSTSVILRWTKPKGTNPNYYDVLRNGAVLVTYGGTVLAHTDSTATAGVTYIYQIRARGSTVTVLALSNTISASVIATPKPVTAPSLTGTLGAAQVSLAWTIVPYADSYTLQRKVDAGAYSDLVSQTGLTYINTGLANGTTYTYRVRGTANAGADVGPWSNEVARIPVASVPVAPTLTGTAGDGENSLDWNTVANASTYRLRRTVDGVTTTFPDTTASDYIDDLLTNGVVHQYTVRGIAADGTLGSLSAPLDLTPLAPPPPPPDPPVGAVFTADAETGDASQWCVVHSAVPVGVVTNPVRAGSYSYHTELRDGQLIYDTERSEYANGPSACEDWHRFTAGSETWTAVSYYFAPGFPVYTLWSLVTQWKEPFGGSPPSQVGLQNEKLNIRGVISESPRKLLDLGLVARGQWIDLLVHHKWSPDPAIGFVHVYRNGVQVIPLTYMKTMENTNPLFLSVGQYRDNNNSGTAVMYVDEVRVGPTRASVELP